MTEQNDMQGSLREKLLKVQLRMDERRSDLLRDLTASFPALRRFLIGGTLNGQNWPAGSISIDCGQAHVRVVLRLLNIGVEAVYTDTTANGLLERIENDLDTENTPWEKDWHIRKRERDQLRKAIGSS